MAFDFPSSPTIGQQYPTPPVANQPVYTWDGEKWTSGTGYGAIYVSDSAPAAPVGSLWWNSTTGVLFIRYNDGNSTQWVAIAGTNMAPVSRTYIAGLTLSTAGSSATFGVAAGVATDSTNVVSMTLAAAISKTTAAWAVGSGNGALDAGAIAINTCYHVHLIQRPDTGVVDVLISLSATAPTLPASYTLFRRIGAMKTDGSGLWVKFIQLGDEFLWATPVQDVNNASIGTTALTPTLSVPTGVQVWALMRIGIYNSSTVGASLLINSPDENSIAVGFNRNVEANVANVAQFVGCAPVRTNIAAQVRAVCDTASSSYFISTYGWIDRRGRDA